MIITDETFNTVVESNELILVDFWAEWCGPCKMVSPVLDDISKTTGLLVGKLNVDENPEKSQEYSVQSIPTMVLFKNGKPVHTVQGAQPKHKLMKEFEEWLN
jgi:thioredoxin 1